MNLLGGVDAAEFRHDEVQDDQVGLELDGFEDGFVAVGGFAANGPVGVGKQGAESLADNFVIISEEDAQRCGRHVMSAAGGYSYSPAIGYLALG